VLQIFRNNDFLTNILVVFYLLLLSTNIWIYPSDLIQDFSKVPATFLPTIENWLSAPAGNSILFFLLILGQAFYLNFLVGAYKITRQYTAVPAVCYILLHFIHVDADIATPIVFANTFLLGALHCILDAYSKKASLGTIFNIGFWIGTASLFYSSYMVYIIWGIIALLIVRTFDLQEFILIILGYLIPFFLAGTWHFAMGDFQGWWADIIWGNSVESGYAFNWEITTWVMVGLLLLPYLLAVLNLGGLQFKTTTKEKKYIYVLLLLPIIGLLTFLVQTNIPIYHFYTFVVPIGILFGLVAQSYKNALWAELIHLLVFMTCMGVQYQDFFFQ
jgi:hypothetical protein